MPCVADPIAAALARDRLAKMDAAGPPPLAPYERSFGDHIAHVFPKFLFTRHNNRLIEIGQRVGTGEIPRLLLMLPPRHYKSTVFSRFLPSWFLRQYPDRTWGQGAHSQPLAEEFGQAARDYFVASGGALDPSSAGKGRWKVAGHLGGFWGAGVGKGTGLPAHFINVDDPIKNRQEAESAAYRRQLYDWWSTVLNTREEPGCIKLITHTRWADADLIGWLITQVEELERDGNADAAEPWHVIQMPMIAEPVQIAMPASLTVEPDDRQPGEALDPDRFDAEWARKKRLNTPDRDWAALFQQRPQPDGGTVFSAEMIRYYGSADRPGHEGDAVLPERFIRVIASIDCTFKDTAGTDMVAFQNWGQTNAGLWLLDAIDRRMDFSATVEAIKAMWPQWRFGELLVEDKANGPAVISVLKRDAVAFTLHAIEPDGGKVARANAATPQFNQGRVFLPRWHPLTPVIVNQLLKFPGANYDDQVDAATQLVNWVQGTGPIGIGTAYTGYGTAPPEPNPYDQPKPRARLIPRGGGFR